MHKNKSRVKGEEEGMNSTSVETAMSSNNRKRKQRGEDSESPSPPSSPATDDEPEEELMISLRYDPPAHFTFRIEDFAFLSSLKFDNYESGVFEAAGFKWKLSLYPNGNTKGDGEGHISLYLVLADTKDLPSSGEVNVIFKLFIYDINLSKWLTIQDGKVRCFSRMRTEWGFDQLIPIKELIDPGNGYLFHYGSCEFGAEVSVIKHAKEEYLDMIKNPRNGFFFWKLVNFSAITKEHFTSHEFVVGGWKWRLLMYPKGDHRAKGLSLSLFLMLADYLDTLPSERKIYAKYKLRIRDQVHRNHHELEDHGVFRTQSRAQGHVNFLMLEDLKDLSKGFILNDNVIVEAEILAVSVFKVFNGPRHKYML